MEKKLKDSWFMNQHYTIEELERLQEWIDKSGNNVEVRLEETGKWSGYHIEDKEKEIGLAHQPTKEDCCNWMDRLGFNPINR